MKKRITVKDVAAKAGVSYQTVSKVINRQAHVTPETEARIWEAAQALGYKPNSMARNLRTQRSHMIGYSWIPEKPNQANHILDIFLTSMALEAEASGYHLLTFPYREGEAQVKIYEELIDTGKVDGFILSSLNYHDPRVNFLLARRFPFVAFGRSAPELDFPYVDVDGTAGVQMATEHLLERGHRRIAILAWEEDSRVGNERLAGYWQAMQKVGLAVAPEWIARGPGLFEFAYARTKTWLTLPPDCRPTGVVAVHDTMAIGAMRAIQESGLRVEKDLAVVGFDDAPMAQYLRPPLTSVRQPIRQVGSKCVEILVALLEGRELPARQILLPPELIVREST